ncbi:inactive hydroxysteroid dehydrogenase-like protein 1 [Tachypleus tridentatus]|uniref:inactive hydroxysteroid dehydrogenase-like protein 1 n=1 Tax=Tachypleus tridentatus TaxID=6853 RepID=UPI003FD1D6D8
MAAVDQAIHLIQEVGRQLKRCQELLAVVGLLYASKTTLTFAWKVFQGFRIYFIARLSQQDFKRYGNWAVVTGGTDGIGKAYCRELAKRGLNIIIVSRNLEKLKTTAEELGIAWRVTTGIIQVDFTEGTRDLYTEIKEQLEDKEIGILVNNVGVMYDYPSYFLEVPETKLWKFINVNITTVTMMTYIVLPRMVQRKKGLIINLSSISSFYPLPFLTVYSASKAYVDWLSRCLDYEYKSKGIVFQTLLPSYISTKPTSFIKPGYIIPDASTFVKSALNTFGTTYRTTGYWTHELQWWCCEHLPESLWNLSSWLLLKILSNGKLVFNKQ